MNVIMAKMVGIKEEKPPPPWVLTKDLQLLLTNNLNSWSPLKGDQEDQICNISEFNLTPKV